MLGRDRPQQFDSRVRRGRVGPQHEGANVPGTFVYYRFPPMPTSKQARSAQARQKDRLAAHAAAKAARRRRRNAIVAAAIILIVIVLSVGGVLLNNNGSSSSANSSTNGTTPATASPTSAAALASVKANRAWR